MTQSRAQTFDTFRDLLVDWLEDTHLFPESDLHIDLILNPHAGTLRHRRKTLEAVNALKAARAVLKPDQRPNRFLKVSTWVTNYPGHEKVILAHLQAEDPITAKGAQRLVVTAGGDGTSRGALISALNLEPQVRESLLFFRLPLGTGNDAAETRDWATALSALSGRRAGFIVRSLPVLEVQIPGQVCHYSFNIASLGLDAFVAHLTNRLRAWLPGNSYSLMVDIAALFYEAFVQVVPSKLELTKEGKQVLVWQDRFLLAAMGTSGNRTYGAGKRILPDHDNFCLAGKKNLFSKLALRKPFYEGSHRGLAGIALASGDGLRVESPVRIPLQMDGEVLWLDPSHFPLTMKIVDHGLRILSLAGSSLVL